MYRNHLVELLERILFHRHDRPVMTRVVHQNIHAPETLTRCRHHPLAIVLSGKICGQIACWLRGGCNFPRRILQFILRTRRQKNTGAFCRKQFRHGPANAASRTRDQRYLVFEEHRSPTITAFPRRTTPSTASANSYLPSRRQGGTIMPMPKTTFAALAVFLGGCLLPGFTPAQQSSAPSTQQAPASGAKSAPASPTQKAPDAKTGTTDPKKNSAPLALETQKDKVSYAVGINLGRGIHKEAVDVDPEILARGLRDGLSDAKPQMTDEEVQATLTELQKQVTAHQQEVRQQAVEKNKKAGEAFLAANKDKPGVVTLPSGLQYKIIEPGTGPKPTASDSVVCNYRGTLIDGTEFDSSYKRGQAATFPVGQVIKGWTEALQLMPVGSKWQLFIPPDLAYGERGTNGGPIGPNETLVFEVQLMSIQAKPQPAPGAEPQAQRPLAEPHPQRQPQAPPPPQPKPQAHCASPFC